MMERRPCECRAFVVPAWTHGHDVGAVLNERRCAAADGTMQLRFGAPVTLTLPDREMLAGRVDACGEDFVEVALLDAPRTPIEVLEQRPLFLEWVTGAGVQRVLGRIGFLDSLPAGESFGVFDVVRFVAHGPVQLLQRREYVRTSLMVGVGLCATRPDAVAAATSTVDVGGGGLLVRGPVDAQVGDELHFELSPLDDGGRVIRGRCRVVRATPDGDLGVQFTKIADGDRDHLVVFAYERELAGRGRRLAA